jgi:hypothetical protein
MIGTLSQFPDIDPARKAADSFKDFENTMKTTTGAAKEFAGVMQTNLGPGFNDYQTTLATVNNLLSRYNDLQDIAIGGTRAMGGVVRELTDEQKELLRQAQSENENFRAQFESTTQSALLRVRDLFGEARASLGDVFKGMFSDFLNFFLNKLTQRLASSIFLSLFGPFNAAGMVAGGGGGGLLGGAIIPGLLRPALPVPTSSGVTVVNNFNAPVMATDEFTRKYITPTLEGDARLFHNKLAVRG